MNSKRAKKLRKMARILSVQNPDNRVYPDRRLMVDPRHEMQVKETNSFAAASAVNDPKSTRGAYRWLKRNAPQEINS